MKSNVNIFSVIKFLLLPILLYSFPTIKPPFSFKHVRNFNDETNGLKLFAIPKASNVILSSIILNLITVGFLVKTESTIAYGFENAVPNNYKMPKSNGPAPTNLGINKMTGLLRSCLKPSPNCFSSTIDNLGNVEIDDEEEEQDEEGYMKDIHSIPRWKSKTGNDEETFQQIGEVLKNYIPGQSNIDGGGFKIIKIDDKNKYYYVQYESLKRGYIDDLEIAVADDASIQLDSSSRLGYLDYGVNAKRLNYIAEKLQEISSNNFQIEMITPKTHPVYFESNVQWEGPGLGLGKKVY